MLTLAPYDAKHLPVLKALLPPEGEPDTLEEDLCDHARGLGRQVAVALRHDKPCGVAGWVTYGVQSEGILYGSPFLAEDEETARRLLERLVEIGRIHGARQLRVSRFSWETAKTRAFEGLGFRPLLELILAERGSQGLPCPPVPSSLERVPVDAIDWERFAQIHNQAFSEVPNAPPLDGEAARQEWTCMDTDASQIWRNPEGSYVAWIAVRPDGYVDSIGVDESLRGRGIGPALYGLAAGVLAAKGVSRLHTHLASTNAATLRLHDKLGFREKLRRTVFGLELAPTSGR